MESYPKGIVYCGVSVAKRYWRKLQW